MKFKEWLRLEQATNDYVIRRRSTSYGGYIYEAWLGKEQVGELSASHNPNGLKVGTIRVREEDRGKGIGKMLYNAMLDHAKELGTVANSSDNLSNLANRTWQSVAKSRQGVIRHKNAVDYSDRTMIRGAGDDPVYSYDPSVK